MWRPEVHRRWEYKAYREHCDACRQRMEDKIIALPFNPLNPELNSIFYLLALLGAHRFLHVSRIRVKLLTFKLLMS